MKKATRRQWMKHKGGMKGAEGGKEEAMDETQGGE